MLMLFPLLPCASAIILMVYWLVVAAYIASAGTNSVSGAIDELGAVADDTLLDSAADGISSGVNGTNVFSHNQNMEAMLLFHFFGLLWSQVCAHLRPLALARTLARCLCC